jgi:predicted ArsR family transcriptional regulator
MTSPEVWLWINSVLSGMAGLENQTGDAVLERCGRECAGMHGLTQKAEKVRSQVEDLNDIDHLFRVYKEKVYNTDRLYKKDGTIYLEYHQCGCPIVKSGQVTNPLFCNCTRGYSKGPFEALFQKPVRVEIQKAILRGDDICKLAIHLEE